MQPAENQELLSELESALKERKVEAIWPRFIEYFQQQFKAGHLQEALSMVRRASAAGLKGECLQDALSRRAELLSFSGDYGDEFDECIRQVFHAKVIPAKTRALRALARSHLSQGDASTGEAYLRSSADQQGVTPEARIESLYELGLGLDAAGQREGALRAFHELLAIGDELAAAELAHEDAETVKNAEETLQDPQDENADTIEMPHRLPKDPALQGLLLHTLALLALDDGQLEQAKNHLKTAISLIEETRGRFHPSFSAALHSLARICKAENRPGDAEPALQLCTAIREKLFGPTHTEFASSLAEYAMVLYHLGRQEEALTYLQQVMEIYDKNLASGLRVAQAQEFYALLRLRQGEPALAEPWAIKALDLYQNLHCMPGQIGVLRMMSEIFLNLGKPKEAAIFADRALDWAKAHLKADHPLQASTRLSAGLAHEALGQYDKALELLREAQSESQRLGLDHLQISACMHNIGGLLGHMGRYQEAVEMLEQALAMEEGRATPDSTAQSLATLGGLRVCLAQYEEALTHLRQAYDLARAHFAQGHPDRISICTALADVLDRMGRRTEAQSLLEEGRPDMELCAAQKHPAAAVWLSKWGLFQNAAGHFAEAEEALRKALRLSEEIFGAGHPEHSHELRNLAMVRAARGDYAEALSLASQALQADEAAFGPHHPTTSNARYALAQIWILNGESPKAQAALQQVIEDDAAFLAPDHPELAEDRMALSRALDGLGQYREAEQAARQALDVFAVKYEKTHPETQAGLVFLAHLLNRQAREEEALPLLNQAIEAMLQTLPETHPDLAVAHGILGTTLAHLCRWPEAQKEAGLALRMADEIYGPHHPLRAQLLTRLAEVTLNFALARNAIPGKPNLRDAEIMAREADSVLNATLGHQNPEAAVATHLCARILLKEGQLDEAQRLAEQAFRQKQAGLPPKHPELALTQSLMGQIALAQKAYEKALPLLTEAESHLKAALGAKHRETKATAQARRKAQKALASD